uniref:NB-ARC domain-containing protein n=1 Tax=Oryza nivara TaxID=4536 RepID=A0A0E0J9H5_ORYNI
MPADEWTWIEAGSIDEAAKKIIDFLDDKSNNRSTVIYFEGGYYGLGSSAVLKEVAKRLRWSSVPEKLKLGLDKIIHVDCSLWQSKRALQKAIAQELKLPRWVMAVFDQRDEEDDFDGVEHGARGVIPDVTEAILNELAGHTCLVIFHNGSGGYIDVQECGVPAIMGLSSKRVLWTSQVRFGPWIGPDLQKIAGLSDVVMFANPINVQSMLHEEAEEVARSTGVPKPGMSPEIVKECIMYYKVVRLLDGNHGIDWATHAANYWVCSGIIRSAGNTSAWEIAQALHTNLRLDWNDNQNNNERKLATLQVPCDSVKASFFWMEATGRCKESLEDGMSQHSSVDRLRVINLSQCTFSFTSPPFLGCSSLRFLLLDRCKDKDKLCSGSTPNSTSAGDTEKETSISSGACFQKLWVLDLSYTDWYWLLSVEAQDLMVELRELNVKGVKHWSISHLLRDDNNSSTGVGSSTKPLGLLNLVKLQVATEPITEDQHQSQVSQQDQVAVTLFPNLSSCKIIKTIILDGCFELTRIDPHDLPPSLESFSFSSSSNDNDVDVTAKIENISFRGCTQLKSVLLRGVFERLKQLDVSGTCIKTLDLRSMRGNWSLKELLLLGCKELRAILWPKQDVSLE